MLVINYNFVLVIVIYINVVVASRIISRDDYNTLSLSIDDR
jgi:hypothetical protein